MEISKAIQGGMPTYSSESSTKAIERKVEIPLDSRFKETEATPLAVKEKALNKEDLQKSVDGLNQLLPSNSYLKFQLHENLNKYYVAIVDSNTNQVIKEIPPKKILDLAADIWEKLGIIVDKKI